MSWGISLLSIFFIFTLATSFFSLSYEVSADEVQDGYIELIDQWCYEDDADSMGSGPGPKLNAHYYGQSFIPTQNILSSIGLYLYDYWNEGAVHCRVFKAEQDGLPDLTKPLAKSNLTGPQIYNGWNNFNFTNIEVIPGDVYFVTAFANGGSFSWDDFPNEGGGIYDKGSQWFNLEIDNHHVYTTDFFFRTYYPSVGKIPIANMTIPIYGNVDDLISFSSENSYDVDGKIVEYNWGFGDYVWTDGENVSHRYEKAGVFEVTLEVVDNHGLSDIMKQTIFIYYPENSPDQMGPEVVSTIPASESINVSLLGQFSITFNETVNTNREMYNYSIEPVLFWNGNSYNPNILWYDNDTRMVFTYYPEKNTTYYITIECQDIFGNRMESEYTFFFTTIADYDDDGIDDGHDPDDDNDGVIDTQDLFPFDEFEYDDWDGDGIGDNADNDDDNDGILDFDDYDPKNENVQEKPDAESTTEKQPLIVVIINLISLFAVVGIYIKFNKI